MTTINRATVLNAAIRSIRWAEEKAPNENPKHAAALEAYAEELADFIPEEMDAETVEGAATLRAVLVDCKDWYEWSAEGNSRCYTYEILDRIYTEEEAAAIRDNEGRAGEPLIVQGTYLTEAARVLSNAINGQAYRACDNEGRARRNIRAALNDGDSFWLLPIAHHTTRSSGAAFTHYKVLGAFGAHNLTDCTPWFVDGLGLPSNKDGSIKHRDFTDICEEIKARLSKVPGVDVEAANIRKCN